MMGKNFSLSNIIQKLVLVILKILDIMFLIKVHKSFAFVSIRKNTSQL